MIKLDKRALAMLLAVLMIISVTACSQQTPTVTPEEKGIFTPGTYTGEANGLNGLIKVEVKVDANKILEVKILEHKESPGISDNAIRNIPESIVEYQSLNIDTVSGATYSSNGILEAVKNALSSSGANIEELMKEIDVSSKPGETINKSADVVIIGGGGAGLAAAVSALQNDAKVIVLEKMPSVGGSTIMAGGQYNAVDDIRQHAYEMRPELISEIESYTKQEPVNDTHKRLMDELASQIEEYKANGSTYVFDSPQFHALQAFRGGDQVGNLELIETLTKGAEESIGWLENLGVDFRDEIATVTGALWQRTHQIDAPAGTGLVEPLYNRCVDLGVEIITNMKAESLVKDESGRVVTVKAVDVFGSPYEFTGSKGIIVETGGFSNNKELRAKYNPSLTSDMVSTNQPGATGDGIIMATEIGAGTTGMEYIQVYPLATPGTGALQGRARKMSGLDDVIVVNKEGSRFINEDARRDDFVAAIKEQTDSICFDINDSTIVEERNSFNENVETLVKLGRIYKGDTLADLEKQLGMPAGSLEKTVAEYNVMVENKNDTVFGRKLFAHKIEVGPFYATPRAPSIHHTMGGLLIDPDAHVLDVNGQIIQGLYAAGEVTGGIHGSNRLGGNATADVTTFGRIAGNSIINDNN